METQQTNNTEPFDQWAIVEIMGHDRYAGRVTEQAIGGASFIRIDVPELDDLPAFTKLFGSAAIFSMTPVTKEVAIQAIKQIRHRPIAAAGFSQRRLEYSEAEYFEDEPL